MPLAPGWEHSLGGYRMAQMIFKDTALGGIFHFEERFKIGLVPISDDRGGSSGTSANGESRWNGAKKP